MAAKGGAGVRLAESRRRLLTRAVQTAFQNRDR